MSFSNAAKKLLVRLKDAIVLMACVCQLHPTPCLQTCAPDHRSIADFVLVKEIGKGAVSSVFYALCKRSCLKVAIKIYTKLKLSNLNARQVGSGCPLSSPRTFLFTMHRTTGA